MATRRELKQMNHQLAQNEIYRYSRPANISLKPIATDYEIKNIAKAIEIEIHNGEVRDSIKLKDFLDIQEQESIEITTLKTIGLLLRVKHTGNISKKTFFNIKHDCSILEEVYTSNTTIQTKFNINENIKFTHNLMHIRLNGENYYSGQANIFRNSTYISNILNIDCNTLQTNLAINLNGKNASCQNNILNYSVNNNNLDMLILVNHNATNTNSKTTAHAIAQDNSSSSVLGKIYVTKDIQQVNADLQIKNLVDSKHATCNSRPQLEIYSDDVKCSHGSTSGSLSGEAIYYMQTRGIDPQVARQLLRKAFIQKIIQNIDIDGLRDQIYTTLNLDTI